MRFSRYLGVFDGEAVRKAKYKVRPGEEGEEIRHSLVGIDGGPEKK